MECSSIQQFAEEQVDRQNVGMDVEDVTSSSAETSSDSLSYQMLD